MHLVSFHFSFIPKHSAMSFSTLYRKVAYTLTNPAVPKNRRVCHLVAGAVQLALLTFYTAKVRIAVEGEHRGIISKLPGLINR